MTLHRHAGLPMTLLVRSALLLGLGIAIGVGSPSVAATTTRTLALTWPHRLSKTASALPRLRDASGAAARRINAALAAADQRLGTAIKECDENAQENGNATSEWDRSVEVAMAGPAFLSLVATDSGFCGGAHPDFQAIAIIFDLQTGEPVNWVKLLPARFIDSVTTEQAMDGSVMGLVRSKRLVRLDNDPTQDCGMPADAAFQLWPDAAGHGVKVAWADSPHVNMDWRGARAVGCVSAARSGAAPRLIDALAHAWPIAAAKVVR